MAIQAQLEHIAGALSGSFDFQRVVVAQRVARFTCDTRSNFWYCFPEWLTSWISSWAPASYKAENRATIEYFYKVFGKRRVDQISDRFELGFAEKFAKGHSLNRRDVRLLFLGMGQVYMDDAHGLMNVVNGVWEADGYFERKARVDLADLRGRALGSFNKEEWDRLYACFVPFEKIETLFLNNLPNFGWKAMFSGKEEQMAQQAYLLERIRREEVSDDQWRAWLTKSMLKRFEWNLGMVIPGPHGHHLVYGELKWGGACLLLLRGIERGVKSMVKAQGTRTNPFTIDGLLSIRDDFRSEIGTGGASAILPPLKYVIGRSRRLPERFRDQYLGYPSEGFRRQGMRSEEFEGLGFSLGSAQMEQLIFAMPDLFSRAFLLCGPGVSEQRANTYRRAQERTGNGPELTYGIEIDDKVNQAGGCHLGWGLQPGKVRLLVFSAEETDRATVAERIKKPPSVPEELIKMSYTFLRAFLCAHGRHTSVREEGQTSLDSFEVFEKHNYDDAAVVDKALSNNDWEGVRVAMRQFAIDVQRRREERTTEAHVQAERIQARLRRAFSCWLSIIL